MSKKIMTITVLELIAKLGELPLDAPVILASDDKGNAFHALDKVEFAESGRVVLWPAPKHTDGNES